MGAELSRREQTRSRLLTQALELFEKNGYEKTSASEIAAAAGVSEMTFFRYFPKSSDLSLHSGEDLDWVAAELNDRPRKRLGFKKPIEQIGPLLLR